jgi:prepilin-type N-terminal cleavage/methylation domain-containing protein
MSGGIQARNGFTLVELMIVIAIISIIVVIAIPSIAGAKLASNEASAISSLRTLTTANQHYRTRFQRYPTALTDLSATGYIDTVLGDRVQVGLRVRLQRKHGHLEHRRRPERARHDRISGLLRGRVGRHPLQRAWPRHVELESDRLGAVS